ncbi:MULTISPECIES: methyl-accepting chemotaxis protein [Oxalobacteraceae]|uniref:methyl-accepting chemotaxis protein n=1 Tax=Herminiimonas sp. Marseille-P9896 TaxID=2742211 RepID=UPI00158C0DFA|nr:MULTISPECIES: methyl-accepting chemotaxis protein [Oxalobacteraceae]
MNILNIKIGARLAMGFGAIFILMATLIVLALLRFNSIGEINHQLVESDWVKAEAAATIDSTTRANARRNMELLVETDAAKVAALYAEIAKNKKTIDEAVVVLDKLVYTEQGKAIMQEFKQARGKYVASFGTVGKLVADNHKEEARQMMLAETLPALDVVQGIVARLTAVQKKMVEQRGAVATGHIDAAIQMMMVLGVLAAVGGIALAYWITHSITKPLHEAVKIAQTVAAGDLTSVIDAKYKDETGQLLQALKNMNSSLIRIVGEVRHSTEAIAIASTQIASGNMDLSSRTEEQASSLEETASSMEELTGTVRQNADNARQANQLALTASSVASKGGEVVSQVVDTMGSINDSAKKIADIIGVIDGIAFQTNILALNAAVEAARAGEQGRGFAVVAGEVRNLAQRSAAAAKEIKHLIGDSVQKVNAGSRLVDDAGSTMQEVVASVRRVTDIMGEITAASQEQTTGIEQINQAVIQMDSVTQQNAALVEQAAAAAASLQHQAGSLAQVVGVFKLHHSETLHVLPATAAQVSAKAGVSVLPQKAAPVQIAAKEVTPSRPEKRAELAVVGDEWEQF